MGAKILLLFTRCVLYTTDFVAIFVDPKKADVDTFAVKLRKEKYYRYFWKLIAAFSIL
jgi:hypothetical protein